LCAAQNIIPFLFYIRKVLREMRQANEITTILSS